MKVKGFLASIVVSCLRRSNLNSIMNLNTLECRDSHALCAIKDLMKKELMKSIIIEPLLHCCLFFFAIGKDNVYVCVNLSVQPKYLLLCNILLIFILTLNITLFIVNLLLC